MNTRLESRARRTKSGRGFRDEDKESLAGNSSSQTILSPFVRSAVTNPSRILGQGLRLELALDADVDASSVAHGSEWRKGMR